MSDVKWIKLSTDIFDNRKIRQIEKMPDSDALIVIWLKLLILAGEVNEGGWIYFTKEIPYTDQLLSNQFDKPLATIQLALSVFQKFGMIEVVDDLIKVSNWEKYQNIEGMDRIREQNRIRKQRQREREKLLSEGHVPSRDSHAIDKEEEKEIDIEIEEDKRERIDYQHFVDLFNQICVSYPTIRSLSEARRKAIKARLKMYEEDDFVLLFNKAEASDFLKGKNDRNWTATFDWLIKDSNMAKVLDGNYDNKVSNVRSPKNRTAEQLDESYRMMKEWSES